MLLVKNSIVKQTIFIIFLFLLLSSFLLSYSFIKSFEASMKKKSIDIISDEIISIYSSSEFDRIGSKYQKIATRVFNLKYVKNIAVVGTDCNVLYELPFGKFDRKNCTYNLNTSFDIKVNDSVSDIKKIYVNLYDESFILSDSVKAIIAFVLIYIIITTIIVGLVLNKFLLKKLTDSINIILRSVFLEGNDNSNPPIELIKISNLINTLSQENNELQITQIRTKEKEAKFQLARQIAHDLNSPTSVLNSLSDSVSLNQEEKDLLILATHRIESITQELLIRDSELKENSKVVNFIILQLVKEKNYELGTKYKTNLIYNDNTNSIITTKLKSTNLSRIISNIINNAAESIPENRIKKIILSIRNDDKNLYISVTDNGLGFEKSILEKIKQGKEVSNKKMGHGLGLMSAKRLLEKVSGNLEIKSSELGSEVMISIPIKPLSKPYFNKFEDASNILILDDDIDYHDFYIKKLKFLSLPISLTSTVEEFKHKCKQLNSKNLIIICDYHLLKDEVNGLEILYQTKGCKQKILCTNSIDVGSIIKKCEDYDVEFLHKCTLGKTTNL